jgi:beta-glucosidase
MSYYLGYRWFDTQAKTPRYPFGHGLSYSNFEYTNLQVPCSTVTKLGVVQATVDIKNTGTVPGDEVAFLFASFPGSAVTTRQPTTYKELKGFTRVSLMAGETKRIAIPIRVADLSYYDTAARRWQVESGTVKVMVGPSAGSLPLTDTFVVQ